MATHVSSLIVVLEKHRKALNQVNTPQLNSTETRNTLRLLVEEYFNVVRPQIAGNSERADNIDVVDSAMQNLLELCHKRGGINKYKDLLSKIKRGLITLDTHLVSASTSEIQQSTRDPVDSKIIVTLRALLPTAALSYDQALIDLENDARISWRGPATDLREALRETLDHLAPDKDVEEMSGYKPVAGAHHPTMKQKVRFILKNRGLSKSLSEPAQHATDSIDESVGQFIRSVYTRSSISTHTPTDRSEVLRVLDFVRVVLCELLEIRR